MSSGGIFPIVTILPRFAPFLLNVGGMKMQVWKLSGDEKPSSQPRAPRRKSVAAILRAAYRRFASDTVTRRAVRRCLP